VAAGFNGTFANYLNQVYQTGFEPEILIEPKTDSQPSQESFFLFTMPSGKSAYFACLGDRR
jgi:hypothetical protein